MGLTSTACAKVWTEIYDEQDWNSAQAHLVPCKCSWEAEVRSNTWLKVWDLKSLQWTQEAEISSLDAKKLCTHRMRIPGVITVMNHMVHRVVHLVRGCRGIMYNTTCNTCSWYNVIMVKFFHEKWSADAFHDTLSQVTHMLEPRVVRSHTWKLLLMKLVKPYIYEVQEHCLYCPDEAHIAQSSVYCLHFRNLWILKMCPVYLETFPVNFEVCQWTL